MMIPPVAYVPNDMLSTFSNNVSSFNGAIMSHTEFQKIIQSEISKSHKSFVVDSNNNYSQSSFLAQENSNLFNLVSGALVNTSAKLTSQDITMKKYLLNKASLTDVLTYSQEASNQLKLVVEIRNKILESLEKVMNMSL